MTDKLSDIAEVLRVSDIEGRGNKAYWKRNALLVADLGTRLEQRVERLKESIRVAIKIIALARSVTDQPAWVGKLEEHLAAEEEA